MEWKNYKINLIDTPGLFDFEEAYARQCVLRNTMLIAVSAKSGVSVGTEKAVAAASQMTWQSLFCQWSL
ncbi:MAG: GTP-binding protein [Acutalibacteraceae bacterium]